MENHICRAGHTCKCYALASEPNQHCPIHGDGYWPPRCEICGRFIKWKVVLDQQNAYFDELHKTILKANAYNWAMYFDPDGTITLEHFPDDYAGDLEQSTGDYEISGSLEQIVKELKYAPKMLS